MFLKPFTDLDHIDETTTLFMFQSLVASSFSQFSIREPAESESSPRVTDSFIA